jgi:hypothetical protein
MIQQYTKRTICCKQVEFILRMHRLLIYQQNKKQKLCGHVNRQQKKFLTKSNTVMIKSTQKGKNRK